MSNEYIDIKVFFNISNYGEWCDVVIENGDLIKEDGFETAILISLFSDAYVKEPGKLFREKRGWWAEKLFNKENGSKWWILERSNITRQTLRLMEQYGKDALQWMIDDGIAVKIEDLAIKRENNIVDFYLVIYRQNQEPWKMKFEFNWLKQTGSE